MTIGAAHQQLLSQLSSRYESGEAAAITDLVMDNITGRSKLERLVHKDMSLSAAMQERLDRYTDELLQSRPVQYVLGEAWFCDLRLFVNEAVLIPRPETEELVAWIAEEARQREQPDTQHVGVKAGMDDRSGPRIPEIEAGNERQSYLKILDIGTGSGCIAVALKKALPAAFLYGCDISAEALEVAAKNAHQHDTAVEFFRMDLLDPSQWATQPRFDIIVSNPPYIPLAAKQAMAANVVLHEPHLALFVPDNDPFIFYRQIARFARIHLYPAGRVYVETHADSGMAVSRIFEEEGLADPVVRKDMQGKERLVRALHRSVFR